MAEHRCDAVIFDMDGVLIDSGEVYSRHWRRWADEHGADHQRLAMTHPGRPPAETIRIVAPHLDPVAEAARFNAELAEQDTSDEITALPGAKELVTGLPAGRWTIATSALGDIARHWLARVGLPVPSELVSADQVERGKPAPDPYLKAAERLGVDARRCLVIEDAPAGISAAKAAGATVVAVRTTHEVDELTEADAVIDGLRAIDVRPFGLQLQARWGQGASVL